MARMNATDTPWARRSDRQRIRIEAVNLARAIVTFGFWGLAASLPLNAKQAAPPVSVESPGMATVRLETYVPPVYPQIAQAARVAGEVVLEATIGADGRLSDLRVLRSIPLLDQAALDAARQWRFAPLTFGDASSSVRVPIRIVFQPPGSLPPPMSRPVTLPSPSLPQDFAIVFASNCPDQGQIRFDSVTGIFERRLGVVSVRVHLWAEAALLERMYEVIARTGWMCDTTRLTQWPIVAEAEVSESGIRALVFPDWPPPFEVRSQGRPPRQFLVDVRMNGTWTRLFPPASWPSLYAPDTVDARDGKLEQGALQIARLLEQRVQSSDVVRKLPRDQQWCRWPD